MPSPAPAPATSMDYYTPKLANTGVRVNETNIIGNKRPPNMASIPKDMLKAASPKSFNLVDSTWIDTTEFDSAGSNCRNKSGNAALSNLITEQKNLTYFQPRCGWNMTSNRGALGRPIGSSATNGIDNGTAVYGLSGEPDAGDFRMDLCTAYRTKTGFNHPVCSSAFTDMGNVTPTANASSLKKGLGIQGNLNEAFSTPSWANKQQNFIGNQRQVPILTQDSFIFDTITSKNSLNENKVSALTQRKYKNYEPIANPGVTASIMQDGVKGINTSINTLSAEGFQPSKNMNTSREMFINGADSFNFCSEIQPTTKISNAEILKCIQKQWIENGGSPNDPLFPKVADGKTYQSFLDSLRYS